MKTIKAPKNQCYVDLGRGERYECSQCGSRYCICKERRDGTWENDLPICCPQKSKTIKDILERFRKKFPRIFKFYVYLENGRESYTSCEVEVEQFITTEIKELLGGLKGEEDGNGMGKSPSWNDGYNQRESKLRNDINKILK